MLASPTRANNLSITKSNTDPKTGTSTFANDSSEQDAFAEFFKAKYSTKPYAKRDTVAKGDFTIQNLFYHSDFFKSSARNVIYNTTNGVKVYNGGFGSDMAMVPIGGTVITSNEESETLNESKIGLNVYPNPTSDNLYFNKIVANGTLVDLIGNTVRTIKDSNSIFVGDMNKGIYILKSGTESEKVLVK